MSTLIETETIAKNRYATPETSDIRTYSFNGCEGLTLGQLVNAVCCRVGAALEAQSVNKSNIITGESDLIDCYAYIISGIVDESVNYETVLTGFGYEGMTVREFLTEMGFTFKKTDEDESTTKLPVDLSQVNNRILAYDVIKEKTDALENTSQQDMIDLQTYISRRDVAFSTATNTVRAFGGALNTTAGNL